MGSKDSGTVTESYKGDSLVGKWLKKYVRLFMSLRNYVSRPVKVKRNCYQMLFFVNKMFTSFCSKMWYFFTPT